jgi:hypothetical protein
LTSWEGPRPEINDIEFTLRFDRAASGYRMDLAFIPSEAQRESVPRAVAELAGRPVTFLVAMDASIQALDDEPAFWAALEAAFAARAAPPARAIPVEAVELMRAVRRLPDEQRLAMLAGPALQVLAAARLEAVTGERRRLTRATQTMFGRALAELTVTVTRVEADRAEISLEAAVPPERLQAMLQAVAPPEPAGAQAFSVLSSSHDERIEVSLVTGLVSHVAGRAVVEMDLGGRCIRIRQNVLVEAVEG